MSLLFKYKKIIIIIAVLATAIFAKHYFHTNENHGSVWPKGVPAEYSFGTNGLLCFTYSDASEAERYLISSDTTTLKYLLDANRCFLAGTFKLGAIRNVSLINIMHNEPRYLDVCKIRVYLESDAIEVWSPCAGLIKDTRGYFSVFNGGWGENM